MDGEAVEQGAGAAWMLLLDTAGDVECQRRQQHQAARVMQPGYLLLHLHRAKNISEDMSSRPLVLLQLLASCYTVCPSSVR